MTTIPKKKRGRASRASLEIAASTVVPLRALKLDPPADLSADEAAVWRTVVEAEPAEWFRQSVAPMLAQYCRHVIQARRIGEMMDRATAHAGEPDHALAITDWDRLSRMANRETRMIATLATKMRIAQQSTINWRGNVRPHPVKKPWEA